jgi:hypothetical protein
MTAEHFAGIVKKAEAGDQKYPWICAGAWWGPHCLYKLNAFDPCMA